MIDSRMPWLAVGASSTTDLDSASSLSLLHSIYGSQASQLPFSESDLGPRSSLAPASATPWRQRPKSSPAATLAARTSDRQLLRPGGATGRPTTAWPGGATGRPTTARPGGATGRPTTARPGTATGRPSASRSRRPASSVPRRPQSAFPVRRGGGARPKTALGMPSHLSSSAVVLEEDTAAIMRDTAPVRLTRTPEYFNFWEGKPLLKRDYGVQVHRRKVWHRPKSDYGSRFWRSGGSDKHRGETGGLETLVEQEGSTLGSGEGDDGDRSRENTSRGQGDDDDLNRIRGDADGLGDGAEGGGDGEGEGEAGQDQGDGLHGDAKSQLKGRGSSRDSGQWRDRWKDKWAKKKGEWETGDGSSEADRDEYFKKKALGSASWMDAGQASSHTTRFELPMDILQLEGMSPLQYLRNHTVISERRMTHCSKVFTKLDKDRDSRINSNELVVGIIDVLHHCITADQARSTLQVAQLPADQQVDVRLFAAICCLAERMHNLYYLPIARREVIEVVDFEALEWKLRACTIRPALRTLFAQL